MIYLDYAATAPVSERAAEAFLEVSSKHFGNSESNHAFGRDASKILERSRSEMLSCMGLSATHGLIFTSGATEANNLAIKGAAFNYSKRGRHIITSAVEHPSVLKPFEELRSRFGFEVTILPVREDGTVDPETLAAAMRDDTVLVSIMAVNNEVGSVNDILALSEVVRKHPKAVFHTDITQAIGKCRLPYGCADLLSFSGHKFGSAKGVGGLFVKKGITLFPINAGGEQEGGRRGGTVNVAGNASMAAALSEAIEHFDENEKVVSALHDWLYRKMMGRDDVVMNSTDAPGRYSPYVVNVSLKRKKASVVVEALSNEGIYVSSVSACSSKEAVRSDVVAAMGRDEGLAENTLRVSFGPLTTMSEVEAFYSAFDRIMGEVRDR
jgi:cysteine desulfurase